METYQDPLVTANATIGRVHYQTTVNSGNHTLVADEPMEEGGMDTGMSPYNLLLASLASCTVITLRMYINRKMWVIDEIGISLELFKTADGVHIESKLSFKGKVIDEQLKRLVIIANACPIHKILVGNVKIKTSLL